MTPVAQSIQRHYQDVSSFSITANKKEKTVHVGPKAEAEKQRGYIRAAERGFQLLLQQWKRGEFSPSSLKKGEIVYLSNQLTMQYEKIQTLQKQRLQRQFILFRPLCKLIDAICLLFRFRPHSRKNYTRLRQLCLTDMRGRIDKALRGKGNTLIAESQQFASFLVRENKKIFSLLVATESLKRGEYGDKKESLTHLAVRVSDFDFVRCETEVGMLKNTDHQNPLQLALDLKNFPMVAALIKRDKTFTEQDASLLDRVFDDWLHHIIQNDDAATLDYLLKNHSTTFHSSLEKWIEEACQCGSVSVLSTLLQNYGETFATIKQFSFSKKIETIPTHSESAPLHLLCQAFAQKQMEDKDFTLLYAIAKQQALLSGKEEPLAPLEAVSYLEYTAEDRTSIRDQKGKNPLDYLPQDFKARWRLHFS